MPPATVGAAASGVGERRNDLPALDAHHHRSALASSRGNRAQAREARSGADMPYFPGRQPDAPRRSDVMAAWVWTIAHTSCGSRTSRHRVLTRTPMLLIGVRGKVPARRKAPDHPITATRCPHSAKPVCFREIIEHISLICRVSRCLPRDHSAVDSGQRLEQCAYPAPGLPRRDRARPQVALAVGARPPPFLGAPARQALWT